MKKLLILIVFSNAFCFVSASPLEVVTEVLDRLYEANGHFVHLKPRITISSDTEKVAAFYPRQNLIIVEEKAYQICQTFGKNALSALAFIIGHELAHTKDRRHDSNYLAFDYAIDGDKQEEYNADVFGLFNAYLADYKSIEILPNLIDKIYEDYNLKGKALKRYPSLEERQHTARTVKKTVKRLIQVYEGANYLASTGKYDLAAVSYEYIANYYQGRELYNNMAVNFALHAINFTDKDVDVMLYPLELDWNSRIKKPKTDRGDKDLTLEERQYRQSYLEKAEKYLEKAKTLDPQYFLSDLNMVCVLSLLGNYQEAIDYYHNNKLKAKAQWSGVSYQTKAALHSALAVAYAKQNTNAGIIEARKIWSELKNNKSPLIVYQANYNLKMLTQEPCDPLKIYNAQAPFDFRKIIDRVQIHRVNSSIMGESNKFLLSKTKGIELIIQKKDHSTVYHYSTPRDNFTLQRVTKSSTQNRVIDNLNRRYRSATVGLSDGYFNVYSDEKGIIFFDEKGRIKEWGKFW